MHKRTRIGLAIVATVGLAVVAFALLYPRYATQQAQRQADLRRAAVPVAVTPTPSMTTTASSTPSPSPIPSAVVVPAELNLAIPFTSQAPTSNWDAVHEEYCEEASTLMVGRYFQGKPITGPADAEAGFAQLAQWETDHAIPTTSATAAQVAELIHGVYGLTVTALPNPTVTDLKTALARGALVVVPAAGRKLENPYFTAPGPLYHMLVVKGYTNTGTIITNDPGTRHGADYVYDATTLFNAVGDWNDGHPETGSKVVLIVSQ